MLALAAQQRAHQEEEGDPGVGRDGQQQGLARDQQLEHVVGQGGRHEDGAGHPERWPQGGEGRDQEETDDGSVRVGRVHDEGSDGHQGQQGHRGRRSLGRAAEEEGAGHGVDRRGRGEEQGPPRGAQADRAQRGLQHDDDHDGQTEGEEEPRRGAGTGTLIEGGRSAHGVTVPENGGPWQQSGGGLLHPGVEKPRRVGLRPRADALAAAAQASGRRLHRKGPAVTTTAPRPTDPDPPTRDPPARGPSWRRRRRTSPRGSPGSPSCRSPWTRMPPRGPSAATWWRTPAPRCCIPRLVHGVAGVALVWFVRSALAVLGQDEADHRPCTG